MGTAKANTQDTTLQDHLHYVNSQNVHGTIVEILIPFGPILENTSTASISRAGIYIPAPPLNGRITEIVASVGVGAGAGNSGSTTLNFYRANSASVASATTTSLLASGGISFGSGAVVGALVTATLNTALVEGKDGGMAVSGGTTLLITLDATSTTTVNGVVGYMRWQEDMD